MNDVTPLQVSLVYRPAGELIINWSLLDSHLTQIAAILYHTERGKELEPVIPREFARRIRFIRKCVSSFPELSHLADDIRSMITAAKEVIMVRDALVHGAISSYDESDKRYSFKKLDIDRGDNIHVLNTIRMTLDDIEEYAAQSQRIMTFAIKVSDYLIKTFPRQEIIR